MNELLNEMIIISTKDLFRTTFGKEVVAGEPYLIETDSMGDWDTSGIVSVTGVYAGLIAIRFRKSMTDMLLHEVQLFDHKSEMFELLTNDMVGEITNIIAGNSFSSVETGEIFLSIPVTIQGEKHLISWSREPRITIIPFSLNGEPFNVETEIKKIG